MWVQYMFQSDTNVTKTGLICSFDATFIFAITAINIIKRYTTNMNERFSIRGNHWQLICVKVMMM